MNNDGKPAKKVLLAMFAVTVVFALAEVCINAAFSPKFVNSFFIPEYSQSENNIAFENAEYDDDLSTVFPIGINTATLTDLQLIPGIGPITAEMIIDYRNEHGTILDFNELISIDGIGDKTIEILKEYCIIN